MQPVMTLLWREAAPPLGLSVDEAHVWAVSIDERLPTTDQWPACLTRDELTRAEQFQVEAARRRFVVTRVALRRLLGQYLGVPAADVVLAYSPRGKPLLGEPAADSLRFNLAHTSDLALIAVTCGCDIGVDVERLRAVSRLESIARRYFHPVEVSAILEAPVESRNKAFLRCWTAKEAVIKAIGTGLTDSLNAFRVPVADTRGAWIDLSAIRGCDATRCWLEHLTPGEGAVGAVAFVGEQRRVNRFTLKDDKS
jgi:4'-phosphopantetheinyl transferase